MTTRMMIVEAISEDQARDVRNLLDAHAASLMTKKGFQSSVRLSEEEGRMIVFQTTWADLESALQYGASAAYRHTESAIMPYVLGGPVTKFFRCYSETDALQGVGK